MIEQFLERGESDKGGKGVPRGNAIDMAQTASQVQFLQLYRFKKKYTHKKQKTTWKASLKFLSNSIFNQGLGKDMFMVDTVSFPTLCYLFGEYVYILLSADIYQAETQLGKGDLLSVPLCFERL